MYERYLVSGLTPQLDFAHFGFSAGCGDRLHACPDGRRSEHGRSDALQWRSSATEATSRISCVGGGDKWFRRPDTVGRVARRR